MGRGVAIGNSDDGRQKSGRARRMAVVAVVALAAVTAVVTATLLLYVGRSAPVFTDWHLDVIGIGAGLVVVALGLFALWTATLRRQVTRHTAALSQSEAHLRSLFDGAGDAIFVCVAGSRIVDVNRQACAALGYRRDELLALTIGDIDMMYDPAQLLADLRALGPGETLLRDGLHRRKDGSTFPVELRIGFYPQSDRSQTLALARDVTARRQAEDRLRESEQRFRDFTAAASDWFWEMGPNLRFTAMSARVRDHFGLSPDLFIGKTRQQAMALLGAPIERDQSAKWHEHFRLLEQRQPFRDLRFAVRDGAGRTRHFQISGQPVFAADGVFRGYRGVGTDITSQVEAEQALRAAKDEAERANVAKSRFLAVASHDVRQPMHALGLLLASLSRRVEDAEIRSIVSVMEESLAAMSELFNALLDVSKLDAGVIVPEVVDLPVAPLLARMANDYGPQAREKGLDLRIVACSSGVRSDPVLLDRIVRNLVSNAIVHTRTGRVVVGCRRRGDRLRIEVHDSGPGIPANQLDVIFQEFRQLDNPGRDRRQGLGLGLAIVERLARLLGHRVTVVSAPGRGSTFALELPRTIAMPQISAAASAEAAAPDFAGARVLVLDDDAMVLAATERLLSDWGCTVYAAASAGAALEQLVGLDRPLDLMIADRRLAEGEAGERVLARIRASAKHGGTRPAAGIIVTGETGSEVLRTLERSGFKVLNKPVRPARLRALVAALLRQRDGDGAGAPPEPTAATRRRSA
jgi:PAS domain S-box-containing protein